MKITSSTTTQEVSRKTKNIIKSGIIPNMVFKSDRKPNGTVTENKDYQYWLNRLCR